MYFTFKDYNFFVLNNASCLLYLILPEDGVLAPKYVVFTYLNLCTLCNPIVCICRECD